MDNFLRIPEQYMIKKPFSLKTFELGSLTNAERKRLRQVTKQLQLICQIEGEEIPSLITEDYNIQAILMFQVILQSLNHAKFVTALLQKVIKPFVIFQCFDDSKEGFILNFATKRLNKLNLKETIIEGMLLSPEMVLSLPNSATTLFQKYIAYNQILNRSNKLEFYLEMYLKAFIITHKNLFREFDQLLQSKLFYNFEKMKQLEKLLLQRIELTNQMLSCATIADKAKINILVKNNHTQLGKLIER
jgi:hypothetical protein